MRVIAGSARGAPLKAPPGAATRPTSDKVRGAIFDALAPDLRDARVLDLFAGTGGLGVEALSRGAASCLFVERAAAVCRVIDANLRATRLSDRATIWPLPVAAALDRLERALTPPPPLPPEERGSTDALARSSHEQDAILAPQGAIGSADAAALSLPPPQQATGSPDSALRPPQATGSPDRVVPPLSRTRERRARPADPRLGSGGLVSHRARPADPRLGSGGLVSHGQGGEGPRRGGFLLPPMFQPPYNVIVLDPPYDDPEGLATVERVSCSGLLAPEAIVVFEHGKRLTPPTEVGPLRLRRTRLYGDTAVTIWQRQEQEEG